MRFDPTGARVLLIGDSLSCPGGPLALLADEIERLDGEVDVRAREGRTVGSTPWRGMRSYDVTLVALGTNDHHTPHNHLVWSAERLLERTGAVSAQRVLWIGPPACNSHIDPALQQVDRLLRRVVGDRDYVSLRMLTEGMDPAGRTRDGVHFTREGARWVADGLASILLPPTGEEPPPARVVRLPGVSPSLMVGSGLLSWIINRRIKLMGGDR